jgi:integrase
LSGQSHLDKFFQLNPRAIDITTSVVEEFNQQRRRDGASNLSLGLLRQMFSVAVAEGRIAPVLAPVIKLLKAPAARKGFLEPENAKKLFSALPDDLRALVRLGLVTGMCLGEVRNLKHASVDLRKGEIHLTAEETKTGEPRVIPLGEMLEVLRFIIARCPGPYVFGGDRPLGDFRERWMRACVKAGLGVWQETLDASGRAKRKYVGLTFHDLRRSAVRNFVRSGTSEAVAMKITGHKTRAVFDRYNITSTKDIHEAARLRDAYDKLQNESIEQTDGKSEPLEG